MFQLCLDFWIFQVDFFLISNKNLINRNIINVNQVSSPKQLKGVNHQCSDF